MLLKSTGLCKTLFFPCGVGGYMWKEFLHGLGEVRVDMDSKTAFLLQ